MDSSVRFIIVIGCLKTPMLCRATPRSTETKPRLHSQLEEDKNDGTRDVDESAMSRPWVHESLVHLRHETLFRARESSCYTVKSAPKCKFTTVVYPQHWL